MKIRLKDNQLEEIEGLSSEYPYVYHYANLSSTKIPWHWHEELEFNYVVSGTVKLITPNETYLFHKNEGFFINSNVLCTMEQEQPAVMDSHLFHPVFLYGHFKSVFATKYVEPVLQNKKLEILEIRGVNRRQREMLVKLKGAAYLQKRKDTEFQTRNLFSEIWLLLLEEMKQQEYREAPDTRMSQERIQSMMAFIQQNYQEKISLEDIALSASVSKRECLRCFRNCIHKTPFEYLQDHRIEMAKRLLRTTDLPAIQVGLQTGFSNGAYFGKIFKSVCGQTPGEYRKMQRQ